MNTFFLPPRAHLLMWPLLTVIIWITSLITLPSYANGFWFPKDMAWLVGSFLLASSPWWNPPNRPGILIPALGWLFAWIMLSFAWFVIWPQVITLQTVVGTSHDFPRVWYVSPILPTMTLIGSFLALDALVRHTDTLQRWNRVALNLVRISTLLSIITIVSILGLNPLSQWIGPSPFFAQRYVNIFGNPTILGNLLAITAPLCLMFSSKIYRVGSFFIILTAIAITHSVMSLGVAILSSMIVLLLQSRFKLLIFSIVLVTFICIGSWYWFPQDSIFAYINPHGRIAIWNTALEFWAKNPLNAWIGYGAGSVGAMTTNGTWNYGFLHNDWLELMFEFGMIGLTLTLLILIQSLNYLRSMVITGASSAWIGSALAYGILMITSFPTKIGSLLMVGVLIAAAVISHCKQPGGNYAKAV